MDTFDIIFRGINVVAYYMYKFYFPIAALICLVLFFIEPSVIQYAPVPVFILIYGAFVRKKEMARAKENIERIDKRRNIN